MNKRLNMMSTLVELLNLHMDGYSHPRQQRRPKFSIHGKDQNIKVKIQIHENQVGELVLYDPRTDRDYDNPSVNARGHHGPDIRNNNWPEEIKKLSFSRHEEGRDYWAALDIVHLMAMHGFRVQAYGVSMSHLYIGGQLLPDSTDLYGRFSFWMDVTTAYGYWRRNDPLAEEPVTIPTMPELTEEQRCMDRKPRGPLVGASLDYMGMYRQMPKGGYYEGSLDKLKHTALGGVIILEDSDTLPKEGSPTYDLLRSFNAHGQTIDYYQQRLVVGDPLVQQKLQEVQDQLMAHPVVLADDEELCYGTIVKKVNPFYGITKEDLALPPNACIEIDPLDPNREELIKRADRVIEQLAKNPVSLNTEVTTQVGEDGMEVVFTIPGGAYLDIQRGKHRNTATDIADKYYEISFDPLSLGTQLTDPEPISHIDVRDAAGNVIDVKAVPRRRLWPRYLDCGIISEISIDNGTDYPELRGMSRAQLDAHFAAKDTAAGLVDHTEYPEMLGMTREEPDDSFADVRAISENTLANDPLYAELKVMSKEQLEAYFAKKAAAGDHVLTDAESHVLANHFRDMVDGDMQDRLRSGVIEVTETPSDAFDRTDLDLSKHEHLPEATKALLARPTRWADAVKDDAADIPNDDLYQESNPDNWDVLKE